MAYKQSLLVSLFFIALTTNLQAKSLEIEGTIRFPLSITSHGASILHGGTLVRVHVEDNQLTFSIKSGRPQQTFYLLVVNPQHIEYCFKSLPDQQSQQYTVSHRTVVANKPYKFFKMSLVPEQLGATNSLMMKKPEHIVHNWVIQQVALEEGQPIPDDTIILLYNPEYVKNIKSEGSYKLPTILIDKDIVEKVGSIDALHEQEVKYLLASLDAAVLHAPMVSKAVSRNNCTRVINGMG